MDFEVMAAVAANLGGVVAWTAAREDPMIEEVVQAVVVKREMVSGNDGGGDMVALTISDSERQQTYVMTPSAWATLANEQRNEEI